jgi:hypothetical protein
MVICKMASVTLYQPLVFVEPRPREGIWGEGVAQNSRNFRQYRLQTEGMSLLQLYAISNGFV